MKCSIHALLILVLFSGCTGCASIPRVYQKAENFLGTETPLTIQFHSVLYYPEEISLNFPGFIVGIEKSPSNRVFVNQEDEFKPVEVPKTNIPTEKIRDRLIQSKTLYVSHILESKGNPGIGSTCALFNPYYHFPVGKHEKSQNSLTNPEDLISPCPENRDATLPPADRNIIECEGSKTGCIPTDSLPAFKNSWKALDILRSRVEQKISVQKEGNKPYTHILVITMGWNTNQEEAIRNFNSLLANIKQAANPSFNPLFIGVTWPSMWESPWWDPLYKVTSFPTKALDADELGISWLGVLLHQTLKNKDWSLPIIAIGHSFGARASSMGTCVGPAISQDGKWRGRQEIDLLISLEGAYSMNRFDPENGMDLEFDYPDFCSASKATALVSSRYDKAVGIGIWAPFVGQDRTYQKYCPQSSSDKPKEWIKCTRAELKRTTSSGTQETNDISVPLPDTLEPKEVLYINGDDLVRFNAYKTGGGAHSDIYRKEMGKLIWELIGKYAQN